MSVLRKICSKNQPFSTDCSKYRPGDNFELIGSQPFAAIFQMSFHYLVNHHFCFLVYCVFRIIQQEVKDPDFPGMEFVVNFLSK